MSELRASGPRRNRSREIAQGRGLEGTGVGEQMARLPGPATSKDSQQQGEAEEWDCPGSAKAGQLALVSLGPGSGTASGPRASVGESRAKLVGVEMRGARAAPSPAPGHLGRDQGPRSPGPSLSQLAGSH